MVRCPGLSTHSFGGPDKPEHDTILNEDLCVLSIPCPPTVQYLRKCGPTYPETQHILPLFRQPPDCKERFLHHLFVQRDRSCPGGILIVGRHSALKIAEDIHKRVELIV